MVAQLRLYQISDYFCEEEGEDINNVVHDLVAETEQIFEVDLAVLIAECLPNFIYEVLREADVVVLIKPVANNDPEEVHYQVVEA